MRTIIVADDAIVAVGEAFAGLGEVRTMPGPAIDPRSLRDADVLLVRSVTRVDAQLVAGTKLRFVGTATAGTDHVDLDALRSAGITFANAAGCNAEAVVQYVCTAIFEALAERGHAWLAGAPLGVVGFGQIGRRLVPKLRALGFEVLVTDPPLQRAIAGAPAPASAFERLAWQESYVSLDELLARCRIVTLHVPWTQGGPDATERLIDEVALARLPADALVINASRGGIVDEPALRRFVELGRGFAIVDTWTDEPRIDPTTVAAAHLATPHIAGYSWEGKLRATTMVSRALATFVGSEAAFDDAGRLGAPEPLAVHGKSGLETLRALLVHTCPLRRDDRALRSTLALPESQRASTFEGLRKHYPLRREPPHYLVAATTLPGPDDTLAVAPIDAARALGFSVVDEPQATRSSTPNSA